MQYIVGAAKGNEFRGFVDVVSVDGAFRSENIGFHVTPDHLLDWTVEHVVG